MRRSIISPACSMPARIRSISLAASYAWRSKISVSLIRRHCSSLMPPKTPTTFLARRKASSLLPPKHILNAPTRLMKAEGYAAGYEYDHDAPNAFSGQDYFPEALGRRQFYDPPERGFEREIRKRLEYWAKLRRDRSGS